MVDNDKCIKLYLEKLVSFFKSDKFIPTLTVAQQVNTAFLIGYFYVENRQLVGILK